MDELYTLLLDSMKRHPLMGVHDAVKFIYQNEMGAGHLVPSREYAVRRTEEALNSCTVNLEPERESIGNSLYRLNLPSVRGKLSAETIAAMFAVTAGLVSGTKERLEEKLALTYRLGLPEGEVRDYLEEYKIAGFPAVSHSDIYKKAYKPAYRLVHSFFITALAAFIEVDKLLSSDKETIIIAIDGDCGSGKSTLGRLMAEVYSANLFCADDYFLPSELRTKERLSEPGGNMHRERLKSEVIDPLLRGEAPVIRRFSCQTMTLGEPEAYPHRRVNIFEGSYCQHPLLSGAYDLKIAVRTSSENQLRRIASRSGEASLDGFKTRWIPMEKQYFEHFKIFNNADTLIET